MKAMAPREVDAILDAAFDNIVSRAVAGKRAPKSDEFSQLVGRSGSWVVSRLVKRGDVISEVYARNFRVFEIARGEFKGMRTAESPHGGAPYYSSRGIVE